MKLFFKGQDLRKRKRWSLELNSRQLSAAGVVARNNWPEDVQWNIVFGLLRLWTLEYPGMGPQVSDSEACVLSLGP